MTKEEKAEKKRQDAKALYRRRREHYIKINTAYSIAHPELRKKIERKRGLKRMYGITEEQYHNMVLAQGWQCFLCHNVVKLTVDHNHTTGKVRKLLCQCCNALIGMAKEDITILRRAIKYIKEENVSC